MLKMLGSGAGRAGPGSGAGLGLARPQEGALGAAPGTLESVRPGRAGPLAASCQYSIAGGVDKIAIEYCLAIFNSMSISTSQLNIEYCHAICNIQYSHENCHAIFM